MIYQIVHAQDSDQSEAVRDVEDRVRYLIGDGWELCGGVSISSLTWGSGYTFSVVQAMTKDMQN